MNHRRLTDWRALVFRLLERTLPPIIVAAGLLLDLSDSAFVVGIRNLVFDNYQRIVPRTWDPETPVRVVDIDDDSIQRIGQWPWPRSVLAELSDKIREAGAIAVGYDIIFSERDRLSPERIVELVPSAAERRALQAALSGVTQPTDTTFAAALARMPSVLAFAVVRQIGGAIRSKSGIAFAGDDPRHWLPHYAGTIQPIPELAGAAAGLGSVVFIPDRDLIVREVNLLFNVGPDQATAAILPSLTADVLREAQGASTIIVKSSNASGETAFGVQSGIVEVKIGAFVIPTSAKGAVRIRYAGSAKRERIPAWQLLRPDFEKPDLGGRIALVGTSATALQDIRSTPLEPAVPGVDIHAELLEHVLGGYRLSRPDYSKGLEAVVLVLCSITALFFSRVARPLPAAAGVLALSLALWTGSFVAFRDFDLLFDPLMANGTMLAAFITATTARFRHTELERRQIRNAFSRYLAPAIVARLEADPSQLRLGGESREVTVLFSDARGFTKRSETLSAEGVVRFLNALHTPMTGIVLEQLGTIDKYIGDGLMAFWNAPHAVPDHAGHACRAALRMMAEVPRIDARLKAEAEAEGRPHVPLQIGIGINSGMGYVGNMGSDQRFDYSVVGDPVNVAARLESATKEAGVDILVSAETAASTKDFHFVPLGDFELKGKSDRVIAFALHAERGTVDAEAMAAFQALHAAALAAVSIRAPDALECIAAAASHPLAAPYQFLYAVWRTDLASALMMRDSA